MKKILGLAIYAALMFGVTAGLGMFMLKKTASVHAEKVEEHDEHEAEAAPHGSSDHETSHERTADASSSPDNLHSTSSDSHGHNDEQLPVAVRSSPMSVEEIVRMGLSLKARDEALRVREQALKDADSQHRLIQTDVEGAQQEVQNLLAQASDQRAAIQELVARINTQKDAISNERLALANEKQQLKIDRETLTADQKQLETQKLSLAQNETDLQLKRKEIDLARTKLDGDRNKLTADSEKLGKDRKKWVEEVVRMNEERQKLKTDQEQLAAEKLIFEQDKKLLASTPGATTSPGPKKAPDAVATKQNLKELTEMFEGMTPETAASTIKELAANGEIDMVVDVLVQLEQRKASAILDAIADEKLVSEFLVRINSRNSQPRAAKQ